jgi:hypothetical protein
MRLPFAVAAVPLLIPVASTAQTPVVHAPQVANPLARSAEDCPQTTSVHAWDRGKKLQPQKLTELPDANAYAAVLRRIGRCEVPVVVRYGVSGGR